MAGRTLEPEAELKLLHEESSTRIIGYPSLGSELSIEPT